MEGLSNGNLFLVEVDGFGAASTVARHFSVMSWWWLLVTGTRCCVRVLLSSSSFLVISGQSVSLTKWWWWDSISSAAKNIRDKWQKTEMVTTVATRVSWYETENEKRVNSDSLSEKLQKAGKMISKEKRQENAVLVDDRLTTRWRRRKKNRERMPIVLYDYGDRQSVFVEGHRWFA